MNEDTYGQVLPSRSHDIVADIPPPAPALQGANCRTPSELLAHRLSFGNPTYAVEIIDGEGGRLDNTWFFANEVQDAVAIGMRWHQRGGALEQFPEEQNGQVVYRYRVRGFADNLDLQELLYSSWLWARVGADINAPATPEIMTRLRQELFSALATGTDVYLFTLLDFSQEDGEAQFLQDWADEIE